MTQTSIIVFIRLSNKGGHPATSKLELFMTANSQCHKELHGRFYRGPR